MAGRGGVNIPFVTTLNSKALDTLKKKMGEAKKEVNSFHKVGERLNKVLTGAGLLAAGGAFTHLAEEGSKAAKAQLLTENVLKNVGLASSISAKQVEEMSTALSNNTGQSKLLVNQAANVFLGFKNLVPAGADAQSRLEGLTSTAVDLAAKLGVDAPSAAKLLAKALSNPARASMALAKAGIGMTDQAKKNVAAMVKEGKIGEARTAIYKDIEAAVKGLAANTATPFEKFQAQLQNIQEEVGTALLPVFAQLMPTLLPVIATFGQLAAELLSSLLPALKPVLGIFKSLSDFISHNKNALKDLIIVVGGAVLAFKVAGAATLAYRGIMQAYAFATYASTAATDGLTFAQWLQNGASKALAGTTAALNAVMDANPIGVIIIAVAALVGGFILLYKHSQRFRNFLEVAMRVTGKAVGGFIAIVLHGIGFMIRAWTTYLSFFFTFADKFIGIAEKAFGWIPDIGDKIKNARTAFNGFADTVKNAMTDSANSVDRMAHGLNTGVIDGMTNFGKSINKHSTQVKKAAGKSGTEAGKAWNKGFTSALDGNGKTKARSPLSKGTKTVKSPVITSPQSFTVAGTGGGMSLSVTVNGSVVAEKDIARTIRNELIQFGRRVGQPVALGV